jgi:hypothetical protein
MAMLSSADIPMVILLRVLLNFIKVTALNIAPIVMYPRQSRGLVL